MGTGTERSSSKAHVDVVTFTEYTGRSARNCDETLLDGELVIEYEHKSTDDHWTVKARTRTLLEFAAPVFDMLVGITPVESGNRRSFGDRMGRGLVAPWKLPPGAQPSVPLPAGVNQSIWIDTISMLPLRWSISMPAMAGTRHPRHSGLRPVVHVRLLIGSAAARCPLVDRLRALGAAVGRDRASPGAAATRACGLARGIEDPRTIPDLHGAAGTESDDLAAATCGRHGEAPRPRPVWDAVAERVQAVLTDSVRWTGGKQRLQPLSLFSPPSA
jgi:hypothetical protein